MTSRNTRIYLLILLSALSMIPTYKLLNKVSFADEAILVTLKTENFTYQPFFLHYYGKNVNEESTVSANLKQGTPYNSFTFSIPAYAQPSAIRIQLGSTSANYSVKEIQFQKGATIETWDAGTIFSRFVPDGRIDTLYLAGEQLHIEVDATDQYITLHNDVLPKMFSGVSEATINWKKVGYALLISLLIYYTLYFIVFVKFNSLESKQSPLKQSSLMLGILFLIILLLPVCFQPLEKRFELNTEKRVKATLPQMNLAGIIELPAQLNNFVEDHFGLRSFFLRWNAFIKARILGVSPNREKVEIGENNWLYLATSENRSSIKLQRKFTEAEYAIIRHNLVERDEWYKLQGITYYVVIVPDKTTIYNERIPKGLTDIRMDAMVAELTSYLRSTTQLRIIDLTDDLFEGKKKLDVYQKYDTHWNDAGAYIAYHTIMKNIRKDFPDCSPAARVKELSIGYHKLNGDLNEMMSLPFRASDEPYVLPKNSKVKQSIYPFISQYRSVKKQPDYLTYYIHSDKVNAPSIYIENDSYGSYLHHLIPQHFSKTVFLFNKFPDMQVLKEFKPNIVVTEVLDRMLSTLILPNPPVIKRALMRNGINVNSGNRDTIQNGVLNK